MASLVFSPPLKPEITRLKTSSPNPIPFRMVFIFTSMLQPSLLSKYVESCEYSSAIFSLCASSAISCSSSFIRSKALSRGANTLFISSFTVLSRSSPLICSRYPTVVLFAKETIPSCSVFLSGYSLPVRIRRSVVFPQPFTPTRPILSFSAMLRVTLFRI